MSRFALMPTYHYENINNGNLVHSASAPLRNYRIYGNFEQNGTPTAINTVSFAFVGDLVTSGEHSGQYKIGIVSNNKTYNIYLTAPLRKIGDYTDYIDFKNKKIVRKTFTEILVPQGVSSDPQPYKKFFLWASKIPAESAGTTGNLGICATTNSSYSKVSYSDLGKQPNSCGMYKNTSGNYRLAFTVNTTSIKTVEEVLKILPSITVIYPLATVEEESIDLPEIMTEYGDTTITIGTTVQPSQVEYQYYKE